MLAEWGYTKASIWVDEENHTVKCGQELVASAEVSSGGSLNITLGPEWAAWDEFQQKPELQSLILAANNKLGKADVNGKGKSKNKDKGKAKGPVTA